MSRQSSLLSFFPKAEVKEEEAGESDDEAQPTRESSGSSRGRRRLEVDR